MRVSRALVVLIPVVGLVASSIAACSGGSKSNTPLADQPVGTGGSGIAGSTGLGKGGKAGAAGVAGAAGKAGAGGLAGTGGSGGSSGSAGAGGGGAGGSSGAAGAAGSCASAGAGGASCPEPTTCHDGMQNGDETDVDCGGSCNAKCDAGHACKKGGDCSEGVCTGAPTGVCALPSCSDGVKNASETDVDCGGTDLCPKCGDGLACSVAADCKSGVCGMNGRCTAPACDDKVQNGDEADVDCGGSCPGKCQLGQKCGAKSDCVTSLCGDGKFCACPAGMIVVPKPAGGAYCIDATEVTYGQYAPFWANSPVVESGACSYKTKYTPSQGWPAPTDHINTPVRWVDWCDAAAYCRFNNKHLCGQIGKDAGVPYDPASLTNPALSEWYNACSADGVNLYPYGAQSLAGYDPLKCAGADFSFAAIPSPDPREPRDAQNNASPPLLPYIVQTGSGTPVANGCQGGAPNLFDMSGNVAEWENSCSADVNELDTCYLRGGSFQDTQQANLTCKALVTQPRGYADATTGIRCCL